MAADTSAAIAPAAPQTERPRSTVRGGFVVHRRSNGNSRIVTHPNRQVFEHSSLEQAQAEAARLAAKFGAEFAVFQEVGAALPPAFDITQADEVA